MSDISSIFGGAFDAQAQDAPASFEPFPAGVYELEIANAEVKDTRDGTGKYVKVELNVLGPTHSGRKVFANFNLANASAEAERIGQQQFGALCRAIGRLKVQDAAELIGGQFQAKVKIRPARDQYAAQNEIQPETCQPIGGGGVPPAPKPAPQAAGQKAAPPWAAKGRAA